MCPEHLPLGHANINRLLPPRQAPSFGNIGSSAPLQDLPSRGPSLPTPPLSNSAQVNDDTDKWGA